MKWVLTITAILILISGIVIGFFDHLAVMTISFLGSVSLLMIANLDRIAEFKATGTGVEAKTRDIIEKAEHTVTELQILARNIGELTLSLVKRNGRIGGYSDDEQDKIKESILSVLKKVGVPESEFSALLHEWHKYTEFDYSHAILGGNIIPENADEPLLKEWKTLREGGIISVPSPDEIRAFFAKYNLLTEELEEYLKDYQYYLVHYAHRRPSEWANRRNWGRLKKP